MLIPTKTGRYITIKSDGKFHETVNKETEGAILREYKLKDGTEGSKWELLYDKIEHSMIKDIAFQDSDFGENLQITLTDGENEVILSENVGTNFGTDLLKKLPGIMLEQEVGLSPYSFLGNNGKDVRGVNVWQKSDKVTSFFWDGEKNLHGFPTPPKAREEMSKTDWQIYFLTVQNFLVNYTKEHIVPKFAGKTEAPAIEYPENEINPEDVAF